MATRFSKFRKVWLSEPSTYPLFVVVGVGCTIMTIQSYRLLFKHPEVMVSRTKRTAMYGMREDTTEEANKYNNHWVRRHCRGKTPEMFARLNNFFAPAPGLGRPKLNEK